MKGLIFTYLMTYGGAVVYQSWRSMMTGELPADWENHLPKFENAQAMATRAASGEVINALASVIPSLIGGSADLGVSNNTDIKSSRSFAAGQYDGRILHFGVREHAMGAALTGRAGHGPSDDGPAPLIADDTKVTAAPDKMVAARG